MPYPAEKMPFKQTELSIGKYRKKRGWYMRTNEYDDGLLVSKYIPKPDYASITIEYLNI